MITRFLLWLKSSFGYLWLIVLAVYFAVISGQAIVRNYQSQNDTKALEDQLTAAENQRDQLKALVVYYQTDSYKEKVLQQSLLLKKANETAYALPESSISKNAEDAIAQQRKANDPIQSLPFWRQWMTYIFSPKANS